MDQKYLNHEFRTYENPWTASWDLASILATSEAQARGEFRISALFARMALKNPTIMQALGQRVAPSMGMQIEVKGDGARIEKEVAGFFDESATACPAKARISGFRNMAMLGEQVYQNVWTPRDDGSRVDVRIEQWPMRALRRDLSIVGRPRWMAQTTDGEVEVVHGDGKWVLLEPYGYESFLMGAVYALAVVYADLMYAVRDRSKYSTAHGDLKMLGFMPEGVNPKSEEGVEFGTSVQQLQRGPRSGMLVPHGADVKMLEALGNSARVFSDIIKDRKDDVAAILLGQSGTTRPTSTAYTLALVLEDVLYSLIALDCQCMGTGLTTGTIAPWKTVNLGAGRAPTTARYLVPDVEEDVRVEALGKRFKAFAESVLSLRDAGYEVDQATSDTIAKMFLLGLEKPLQIKSKEPIATLPPRETAPLVG